MLQHGAAGATPFRLLDAASRECWGWAIWFHQKQLESLESKAMKLYIYIYNIFGYIWKNTHPLTSITQLWVPSGYPGFWSRTIWQLLMIYHGNLLYTQAVRWRSSRLFRTVIHGDVFWPTDGKARLENMWIRSSNHHLGNTVLFFLRVNIAWNSFNEVDMASEG